MKNYSLSHLTAGLITVLVGYTSSIVMVFQAATLSGASPEQVTSWIFALSLGIGLLCIRFSLKYRIPILVAWSTPGAAVLIAGVNGYSMSDIIGAFLLSSALTLLFGVTGWFEKIMNRVPTALASAMLAGVLLRFGADVFNSMKSQFFLSFGMFAIYVLVKRFWPRMTMLIVLTVGVFIASFLGLLHFENFRWSLATPVWTSPTLNFSALVSLGIPLFIVTMTSQNIPGVTILRAFHYQPPTSRILTEMGFLNVILAPVGAFTINLAAITAAICLGKEVDEKPERRYMASVTAGIIYLCVALMAGTMAALLAAFPKELVATVAGLALFSTISNSLSQALRDDENREPALMAFLVAASGLTWGGIGAAFWALVVGGVSLFVWRLKKNSY